MTPSLPEIAATGRRRWAIAEGYLDDDSVTDEQARTQHETLFLVNAGDVPVEVSLSIYFSDRPPLGPFEYTVEARRARQVSLAEIDDIPRRTDFASLIESDSPIVVLATRKRGGAADEAPLTTIALAG